MRPIWLSIWFCASFCAASGCTNFSASSPSSPERRIAELTDQNRRLQQQIEQIEADKTILNARLAELRQRESALSERVHKLTFLQQHQESQMQALSGLTAERDRYKSDAEKLQARIELLNRTVADLRGLVSSLAGAEASVSGKAAESAPASAPQAELAGDAHQNQ